MAPARPLPIAPTARVPASTPSAIPAVAAGLGFITGRWGGYPATAEVTLLEPTALVPLELSPSKPTAGTLPRPPTVALPVPAAAIACRRLPPPADPVEPGPPAPIGYSPPGAPPPGLGTLPLICPWGFP